MTTTYACFTLLALFTSGNSILIQGWLCTLEHARIYNHTEKIKFDYKGFQHTILKLT